MLIAYTTWPPGGLGQQKKIDKKTRFLILSDLEETLNQGFLKSLETTLVYMRYILPYIWLFPCRNYRIYTI